MCVCVCVCVCVVVVVVSLFVFAVFVAVCEGGCLVVVFLIVFSSNKQLGTNLRANAQSTHRIVKTGKYSFLYFTFPPSSSPFPPSFLSTFLSASFPPVADL